MPWRDMEAFVGHLLTSRLKLGARRLGRLHPAQIADLVEAASHKEGEEILEALAQDKELEADVFEELDDEHQVEFFRERTDEQVAQVLGRMASDDVADLLPCSRSSRIVGSRSSTCCRRASSARSRACSATTRPRPAA